MPITLPRETVAQLHREANEIIAQAAQAEITLTFAEFDVYDGELYLDGMDPAEWLEAMTMD